MNVLVAHLLDNGGNEEGESIESAIAAHIDDRPGQRLPVFDSGPEVFEFELFVLSARLLVRFQTAKYTAAVIFTEELGLVGKVVDLIRVKIASIHLTRAGCAYHPK